MKLRLIRNGRLHKIGKSLPPPSSCLLFSPTSTLELRNDSQNGIFIGHLLKIYPTAQHVRTVGSRSCLLPLLHCTPVYRTMVTNSRSAQNAPASSQRHWQTEYTSLSEQSRQFLKSADNGIADLLLTLKPPVSLVHFCLCSAQW